MPAQSALFQGRILPLTPEYSGGQCADLETGNPGDLLQGARFQVCTGGANGLLPDLTYNQSANVTLLPAGRVPANRRLHPTRVDLSVHGNVGWAGGSSVVIQDTGLAPLAFFPLTSLKALAQYSFPTSGIHAPLTLATATPYYDATTGVITFGSSSLINNTLAGYPITVVAGTGKGQSAIISANTATTITVVTPFVTPLDSTSVISVWYMAATSASSTSVSASNAGWTSHAFDNGWSVVIVAGTGAGQVRTISDNTATQLTVATWDTTPSTDSVFIVTRNPALLGALDLCCGHHWTAAGRGAGLQAALNGSFTGSTSSPIRVYAEGFYAQ